jgi:hypothetical protein
MKKLVFIFIVTSLVYSCTSVKKATVLNESQNQQNVVIHDGSSYQNAIIIKEKSETSGISAEYAWIKQNMPGYKVTRQALTENKKKPYDVFDLENSEGIKKTIYFDISNYFGKY